MPDILRCRRVGCTFVSRTYLGLSVHESSCDASFTPLRARRHVGKIGGAGLSSERNIPSTLGGIGKRVRIDRLLGRMQGVITEEVEHVQDVRNGETKHKPDPPRTQWDADISVPDADIGDEVEGVSAQDHERHDEGNDAAEDHTSTETLIQDLATLFGGLSRKVADDILLILRAPKFSLTKFLEKFHDHRGIRRWASVDFEERLEGGGFRPIQFDGPGGTRTVLYSKNVEELLRKQVSLVPSSHFHSTTLHGSGVHPMNSSLAKNVSPVVRDEIMRHPDSTVRWYTSERDCRSSTVGYVQLYSDKSVTSLRASGVQFYPLHCTLLNFSEEARRHMISHGLSILAYLPAGQLHEEDDDQYEDIFT